MKKCPFCGADIEDSARFCLYCMTSLTEKEQILVHKKKKPQGLLFLVAILGAAIILLLLLLSRQNVPIAGSQTQDTTQTLSTTEVATVPTTQGTTAPTTPANTDPTEEQTEPTQEATQPTTKPSGNPSRPTEPTQPKDEPTVTETADEHIHSFHLKYTTEEFLQSEATCECPAIYYYSCPCGQKGDDIFLWGNATGHTLMTLEGYPPPDCVTSGKTNGTYCTVCQQVIQKQSQIQASGHIYAFSSSPTSCRTCGEMGTLTVTAPALPYNYHNIYMVNSGYFIVLPYNSTCYNITMVFNYTNISSQPTDGFPFAGPGIQHSGTHLEPGKSGTYESTFQVTSPYGTYEAYFA